MTEQKQKINTLYTTTQHKMLGKLHTNLLFCKWLYAMELFSTSRPTFRRPTTR